MTGVDHGVQVAISIDDALARQIHKKVDHGVDSRINRLVVPVSVGFKFAGHNPLCVLQNLLILGSIIRPKGTGIYHKMKCRSIFLLPIDGNDYSTGDNRSYPGISSSFCRSRMVMVPSIISMYPSFLNSVSMRITLSLAVPTMRAKSSRRMLISSVFSLSLR